MPGMDLNRVLKSRRFADEFEVVQITRRIDLDGEAKIEREHTRKRRGPVIPGRQSLRRLEDGSRVTAYIDVYDEDELSVGFKMSDELYREADLIRWHGRTYTVMSVEDYSRFGRGFYKASCDLLPLNIEKREALDDDNL